MDNPKRGRVRTGIAIASGIIGASAIPVAAGGRVIGIWPALPTMLIAFLIGFLALLLAFLLGLFGMLVRRGRPWQSFPVLGSLISVVLALAILIPVGSYIWAGLKYPTIHDITTDTLNPPNFVSLVAVRRAAHAANPTAYNPANAAKQRTAFPDIQPKSLPLAPPAAFAKALAVARDMGWHIASAAPKEGRIEASDTTFWSGFVDDIVIRVTPAVPGNSTINVRSLSRVGEGDLGKNAARIREYLTHLGRVDKVYSARGQG